MLQSFGIDANKFVEEVSQQQHAQIEGISRQHRCNLNPISGVDDLKARAKKENYAGNQAANPNPNPVYIDSQREKLKSPSIRIGDVESQREFLRRELNAWSIRDFKERKI